MTPVNQKFQHEPPQMGDCLRACVASVFDLPIDDVPHFMQGVDGFNENWFNDLYQWALGLGFEMVMIDARQALSEDFRTYYFGTGVHIASGQSTLGGDLEHCCVYRNRQLIHDPAGRGGFVGDPKDFIVFVPLDPAQLLPANLRSKEIAR